MYNEEQTRKIVREAVQETLRGLGFDTEHPQEIQADLLYLHTIRKGSEEISRLVKGSVVMAAIPGLLYLFWEVLKQALQK